MESINLTDQKEEQVVELFPEDFHESFKEKILKEQEDLLSIVNIYIETIKTLKMLKANHTPLNLIKKYIKGQMRYLFCHKSNHKFHYIKKIEALARGIEDSGMLFIE